MGLLKSMARAALEHLAGDEPAVEEEVPPKQRGGPCPHCGAPAAKRTESCGFGHRRLIICGVCAHTFGVKDVG